MRRQTRRAYLALCSGTLLGGCVSPFTSESYEPDAPLDAGDSWPLPRRDPGNTAAAPASATPSPETATIDWEMWLDGEIQDFVVASRRVFVTVGPISGNESAVVALDATSGEQQWMERLPDTAPASLSSPFAVDDRVLVSGTDHQSSTGRTRLFALDTDDGTRRWSKTVDGYGISAVRGDILVCRTEDGLSAYRTADGASVWSYTELADGEFIDGRVSFSGTILTAIVEGQHGGYSVVGIDETNGEEQWRSNSAAADFPPHHPTVFEQTVYAPFGDRIVGLDLDTGDVTWTARIPADEHDTFETVAATAGSVVAGDEYTVRYDIETESRDWRAVSGVAPVIGGEYCFGVQNPGSEQDTEFELVASELEGGTVTVLETAASRPTTLRIADGQLFVSYGENGTDSSLIRSFS